MTLIVNLFGAPCSGKSTTRAGVFHKLKVMGYNVEEVTEVAKNLVYEERSFTLRCQPYIFSKQLRDMSRVMGKVDILLTDGPLMLSYYYSKKHKEVYPDSFYQFIVDQTKAMGGINFFINSHSFYSEIGRLQTKAEAALIGEELKNLLLDNNFDLIELKADNNTCDKVISGILSRL